MNLPLPPSPRRLALLPLAVVTLLLAACTGGDGDTGYLEEPPSPSSENARQGGPLDQSERMYYA